MLAFGSYGYGSLYPTFLAVGEWVLGIAAVLALLSLLDYLWWSTRYKSPA